MSTTIDEKVVAMKFDNALFQRGVASTMSALDKLKDKLGLKGATSGIDDVEKRANRISFKGIESGLQTLTDKFKTMSIAGIAAITNLTNKVVDAGLHMGKALAIEPITDGFAEYELKMGSIQTILANTARDGTKLKDVSHALEELNHYADKTIYNFGDMTKNIGLFTNSGIKLQPAVDMIKGFSNEAAASGTSAQGAASAAYQLSQALSAGKITLIDWKSLTNNGMGNKLMQTDIIKIADAMGTLKDKGVKATDIQKNFNGTLEKGWLTADVMSKYLQIMAKDYGAMTAKQLAGEKAQLRKLGLDNKEIDALIAKQKTAQEAATKVRTATQLFGTLKESIGSGWASTFEQIFGNFDEATDTFTDFSELLGSVAHKSGEARKKLIGDWKSNGGRIALADGLIQGFKALMQAWNVVKSAFREIFPPATGKQLAEMTKAFRDFMIRLQMTPATALKVKTIFKGLFAAFSIGWTIVKRIALVFVDLWRNLTSGDGTFTNLILRVSEWLVATDKALKKGEGLREFFRKLTAVLQVPITAFKTLIAVISSVIKSFGSANPAVDRVTKSVDEMGKSTGSAVDWIVNKFNQLMGWFKDLGPKIAGYASDAAGAFGEAFRNGDFNKIVDGLNTGFLGILTLTLRKFMNGISLDLSGGAFENLNGVFEQLTGNLKAMEQNVKAGAILKIAGALALLAASAMLLAMIDPKKLSIAMGALTVMFAQLAVALLAFDKAAGVLGAAKLPLIAAGLILLSVAIGLLTVSVKVLSTMDWGELAKGMAGLGAILLMLAGFTKLLSDNAGRMAVAGVGFVLLAVAINMFVLAIKQFGEMDFDTMRQGLIGVGATLGAIALFTRLAALNKIGLSSGAGLILLAVAMKLMASAVNDFGSLDLMVLGKGLGAMSIGLLAIALAIRSIPKTALLQGAALIVVAKALGMLVPVVQSLGKTDMMVLGKGLGAMAAGLGLIAIALRVMPVAGAAALWIAVDAITNLAAVMSVLAGMGLVGTVAALATLAGALTILGLAGLVLSPIVPVLQALGYAILSMGIGAAAAGLGLMMTAAGLAAISVTGVGAGIAITAIAAAVIGVIPSLIQALGRGLVLLSEVFVEAAPQFLNAMVVLITTLLQAIATVAPRIVDTLIRLINMLLNKLAVAIPKFVDAGMRILIGFMNGIANRVGELVAVGAKFLVNLLNGIANKIGDIIKAGTNLIKKFLEGIAKAVPDVIKAGMKMITDILNGAAQAVRTGSAEMNAAGRNLASAIIEGLLGGLGALAGAVVEKARSIARDAIGAFKSIFDINSPSREMYKIGRFVMLGFRDGMDGNKGQIQSTFESLKKQLVSLRKHSESEVKKLEATLKRLQKSPKKNAKKIKATKIALSQARKEVTQSTNAYNNLTKNWTDDKNRLGQLADQYDKLGVKLKAANQKLADAKKVRDDYNNSVKDQYNDVPSITAETKLQDFANDIRKKIEDNKAMLNKMDALRKLGLNDTMYKELLAKGTDALPFIDQLLGTGKSGVTQINTLSTQLDASAAALGKSASTALYQAAVDSAAGLVKGLQNQQKAIEKVMDAIANKMVASIKKSLGIKSPSREMMKIGKYSAEGVAKGLDNYGHLAEKASKQVGVDAINAMRKSIVGLDDIVNSGVDMRPVVRPVLDLSDIKSKAGVMDSMLAGKGLSATASYGQAKGASVGHSENRRSLEVEATPVASKQFSFVQNNYSPKAIGAAETYRNTNNQLSRLKGALGK